MIDSRFENPSYTKHISKWVRSFVSEFLMSIFILCEHAVILFILF